MVCTYNIADAQVIVHLLTCSFDMCSVRGDVSLASIEALGLSLAFGVGLALRSFLMRIARTCNG